MESFVLLIWENVPEETLFFLIPRSELNEDDVNVLRTVNNKLINTEGWEEYENELNYVLSAVTTEEEYIDPRMKDSKWAMRFKAFKVDCPIENVNITNVYMTGFVL